MRALTLVTSNTWTSRFMAAGRNTSLLPKTSCQEKRIHAQETLGAASADTEEDLDDCELVLGKDIELKTSRGNVEAHLVQPVKNRNGSGVLLLTDVRGVHDSDTRDFAYRLACFGYSVLIPDLFRKQPLEQSVPKDEYESWRKLHPDERVASDIEVAKNHLLQNVVQDKAPPGQGKVALLGFCFGGGRLVETLARDSAREFTTAVMFYGTRFDVSQASEIGVPILIVAGDSDDLCTVETVETLQQKVEGSKLLVYPGRGHAFAHHPHTVDDDEAAELAFTEMKKWLHAHLLSGAPGPWVEE